MRGYTHRVIGLLLFVSLLSFGRALGQTLSVEAPSSVYANQQFTVSFSVDAKPSGFEQPVWGEIQVLMGPSVGQSSRTEIVNGTVSRSYSYSYTFICRIASPGVYSLPSASVVVDGARVMSDPHSIEVVSHESGSSPGGDQGGRSDQKGEGEDIFVSLSVSKKSVYQGEPIEASVRIYTRQDLAGFEDIQFPDFKGFWVKELETPQQVSFTPATVKGKKYNMGVLKRYLLYPQRRGELVIDPVKATVQYRVRVRARSFFDEFMGTYQTSSLALSSGSVTVDVKPLPQGKPSSFLGGVGQFEVNAHLSDDSVKTNDAVTYSLVVSGKGNLQLMSPPTLRLPATVEVFPPKSEEKITSSGQGQSGSVRYEFVLIPRVPGEVSIPPFELSYFDASSGVYRTEKTSGYTLRVVADSSQVRVAPVVGSVNKEDVKYLGEDIRHIFMGLPLLHSASYSFTGGLLWWLLVIFLVLIFVLSYALLSRRQRLLSDVAHARGRRASNVAKRRLRQARAYLDGDDPQFYEVLLRAMWSFLSDSLNMDMAELTAQRAGESLRERGVSESAAQLVREVIDECEYARYAPEALHSSRSDLYDKASLAIGQVDSALRSKGRSGMRGAVLSLFVFLVLLSGHVMVWGMDPDTRFAEANGLYNRGQYDSAIIAYEAIVSEGLVSDNLYYNLGNACYRQGQYAKAILSYERALKHNPSHEDAVFNLGLARMHVTDRFSGEGESVLGGLARRTYTLLAPRSWGWVSLCLLGLFLVSGLVFRFARRRVFVPVAISVALSSLVLAVGAFFMGRRSELYLKRSGQAIIMQSVVSVKSEPSSSGKDLFLLHSGSKVRVVTRLGDWIEISIPDGHRGWVASDLIAEI